MTGTKALSELPKSTESFAAHAYVGGMAFEKMGDLSSQIHRIQCCR
jgi:hypothetical protein